MMVMAMVSMAACSKRIQALAPHQSGASLDGQMPELGDACVCYDVSDWVLMAKCNGSLLGSML